MDMFLPQIPAKTHCGIVPGSFSNGPCLTIALPVRLFNWEFIIRKFASCDASGRSLGQRCLCYLTLGMGGTMWFGNVRYID